MKGQNLLNNTLRVNAVFSLVSGLDFVLFNNTIAKILSGDEFGSLVPVGIMLIGFSIFVFAVSMLSSVNKFLVSAIIAMDVLWVIGSALIIVLGMNSLTIIGQISIALVAAVIALFAFLQTKGLTQHLSQQTS